MSKRNLFSVDKSLEQPERVLLVGVMLTADYSGANETRERGFQTALTEAAELVGAAGGDLVLSKLRAATNRIRLCLSVRARRKSWRQWSSSMMSGWSCSTTNSRRHKERNLEKSFNAASSTEWVWILAIFAKRAQSQEGKLQVELAQLNHLSGRLVRGYGHLQSQKGGIGLKGPGETQLETDRRLIGQKITALKKQLADVRKQRATRRKSRMSGRLKTFAIVGYTNAGKSSLFNRLTKADVLAKDQLFATIGYHCASAVPVARGERDFDRYRRLRPRFAAQAGVGVFRHFGRDGDGGCATARR